MNTKWYITWSWIAERGLTPPFQGRLQALDKGNRILNRSKTKKHPTFRKDTRKKPMETGLLFVRVVRWGAATGERKPSKSALLPLFSPAWQGVSAVCNSSRPKNRPPQSPCLGFCVTETQWSLSFIQDLNVMCFRLKPLSLLVEIEGVIDLLGGTHSSRIPGWHDRREASRPLGFYEPKDQMWSFWSRQRPPNAWNRYHGSYQISKDSLILNVWNFLPWGWGTCVEESIAVTNNGSTRGCQNSCTGPLARYVKNRGKNGIYLSLDHYNALLMGLPLNLISLWHRCGISFIFI
jgi:hypothetical protein